MTRRRVAITGLGVVCSHGDDPAVVFDAMCAGRNAVRVDFGSHVPVAAADFNPSRWLTGMQHIGMDRVSQFAIAAAESAKADAGWLADHDLWSAERIGIYVGTGFGGTDSVSEAYRRFHQKARIPPLSVVAAMANAPAAHIAMRTGVTGPVLTYSIACASSSVAIAAGAKDIAIGEIDAALVGGCEAELLAPMIATWEAMMTLAKARQADPSASSRPFSASRSGLVLGEGAAFLMIEDLDGARRRGARIYAEIAGTGLSCDAAHLAKPQVKGQVQAMRSAIRSAGLDVADVGYCNAHGTATMVGDVVEAESIRAVWGDDLAGLRVSSTKALHGHLLGAAGALETLITTLAVHRHQVPVQANCEDPDPACDIPLVLGASEDHPTLRAAICNSFAFGGTNSSLVLGAVEH